MVSRYCKGKGQESDPKWINRESFAYDLKVNWALESVNSMELTKTHGV